MRMKNPNPSGTASSGPTAVPRNAGGVGSIKPKPIKRRLPPLPSSPVSNPDAPVSVGGSGGPRGAGGPGSLPPIRPGGPVGKGPAVIPRPRNPGADSPLGPQASIGDQGYNPMLPPNHPLQGRGNALPMPVANLPGISNPGGPRLRNAGGVGSLPPQSGGADNPVSSGGNPQWGPGAEAGKADMIDQMQRYPGSGGIYAGGPGSLPPEQGGGSMGFDGEGPAPLDAQIQGMDPNQDPRMQGFLDKINLPARFGGDPQAAMKFLQQNPQSHFGQRFNQYNQNQMNKGGQGGYYQNTGMSQQWMPGQKPQGPDWSSMIQSAGGGQPQPMQYNPLLNMG